MGIKLYSWIMVLTFWVFSSNAILAQDAKYSLELNQTNYLHNDQILRKDSARVNFKVKTIVADQQKLSVSKEEDMLSFNFLYYIIQKFKLSDIIEK